MKLIDYMKTHNLDDRAMADRLGGLIGKNGIRKLKYGERNPSLLVATRIEEVTGGKVRAMDLVKGDRPFPTPANAEVA